MRWLAVLPLGLVSGPLCASLRWSLPRGKGFGNKKSLLRGKKIGVGTKKGPGWFPGPKWWRLWSDDYLAVFLARKAMSCFSFAMSSGSPFSNT